MSNNTDPTPCRHLNGYGVMPVEAMGCESWYYQCEDCGVLTMQVVEFPQAVHNRYGTGPAIDWVRTNRIYRVLATIGQPS